MTLRAAPAERRFLRHGGIYRSAVFNASCEPDPAYRFPVGAGSGHEARGKETRLLIVATSSDRLFLERVLATKARLRFTGTVRLTRHLSRPRKNRTFLLCRE